MELSTKELILNTHVRMCERKNVSPTTTPIKVVDELFYNDSSVFNQSLYNEVVKHAIVDRTQSMEERGALGQRYTIDVETFKKL
jgi:hypothetical protein